MSKPKVYKAQWPMSTTEKTQHVLIYEADNRDSTWYYLPATPKIRGQLFRDKYIRVFFLGSVDGENVSVDEFVRKGEWL